MVEANGDDRPSSAEEAFALLIKLQESGQAIDFETWVSSYPQFESELREFYAYWQKIKPELEEALAGPAGPDSPRISLPAGGVAAPAELPQPRPGARIGEFILVRQIAQGGMGQVWEALQKSLARVVALKLIRSDRIDQHALSLFEREARAGGKVNDPRIVTVYGTGQSDGVRWIAEEYVVGERTLAQTLARDRKAHAARHAGDFERLADFFADVAEAMHAVHEVGVIHRDLKPGNILITAEGRPKITDFGLARVVDEASLTGQLGIAGTVHYMSPEQVEGLPRAINRRSDVFSLGVVLYEALARRRPFEGASTPEILIQITRFDPPDPRTLAPEIPKDLAHIALKALEKEPQRRYATMGELAADLRRFLAHEPIRARPPGVLERGTKWARRHPTTSVACSLVAVLVLAVWLFKSELAGAGKQTQDSRKQELGALALWCIDKDDFAGVEEHVDELIELDPSDPIAHLILATAHARYGRFSDADAQLELARQKDFQPASAGNSPQGLYLNAVYLVARRNEAARREAERILSELVEVAPDYPHAWYPLYGIRQSLDDSAGAARALASFRLTLRLSDQDMQTLVDALSKELDGDYLGAVELLERLSQERPERQVELRLHRHLGRNQLKAFVHGARKSSDLREAAAISLELAMAEVASDSEAQANYGIVQLLRSFDPDRRSEQETLLDEAGALGKQALRGYPQLQSASELLVAVALQRILAGFYADRPDQLLLSTLEREILALEQIDPGSEQAIIARSFLLYFQAAIAQVQGDASTATELFEQSVRTSEQQLYARVELGGHLFMDRNDYSGALAQFQEAKGIWDRADAEIPWWQGNPWESRWGFAIDVWLFGTADLAGRHDVAEAARERALQFIEAGDAALDGEEVLADLLNLAEFLATAEHETHRDCERAKDILTSFDLEARFERRGEAQAGPIFERIRSSCP